MTHNASWQRTELRCIGILLLLLALTPTVAKAQQADQQLETDYFTIYYPSGEEQTAQWYASFADEVDESVSELLGSDPIDGIALTIYNSEAEYQEANPLAGIHPGVLAHAIPDEREIGVAVERLRQLAPELARDSFRHEMTHLIAGELSGQQLPIAFQEGLAQYNEMSNSRAQEVVAAIKSAQSNDEPFLSWTDLNDREQFRRNIDLAYPQAYTMMAFLADNYGMGAFARFLERLSRGDYYTDALFIAYGRDIETLEEEWNDYLPGFLNTGWQHNVLTAFDMAPAIAQYEAGQFTQARESFEASERLYRDLSRPTQAAEAAEYRSKAEKGERGNTLANEARTALESYEYSTARSKAIEAENVFADIDLDKYVQSAEQTAALAQQGLDAIEALERATSATQSLDFSGASADARSAAESFAILGDQARLDQAQAIMNNVWGWQRVGALLVLGLGAFIILLGAIAAIISLRSKPEPVALFREENTSWL